MIRVAFSGGDCAGKTTVINSLPHKIAQKIYLVPEVPTSVMGKVIPRLGQDIQATPEVLNMFQIGVRPLQLCAELMAKETLIQEYSLARSRRAIVFDRAIPDYVAYDQDGWPAIETQLGKPRDEIFGMYDKVFYFDSLALRNPALYQELMSSNPMRVPRTVQEAVELNDRIKVIWQEHPNFELVDFSDGIDSAIRQVSKYFEGIFGQEIEMKFDLATEPDWNQFRRIIPVEQSQYYLAITDELEYRHRRSVINLEGKELVEYSATAKTKGGLVRGEEEQTDWPPPGTFQGIWEKKAFAGYPVQKTRRICVPRDGDWIFEIDSYQQPENRLIAEVTFDTLEQYHKFVRPDWMEGALDVTDLPCFKASEVARNGHFPTTIYDHLQDRVDQMGD